MKPTAPNLHPNAAEWLAHAFSDEQLHSFILALGDAATRYFKGFSVARQNAAKPAVRNRIKANLQHHAAFRSMYLDWPLAPWETWRHVLMVVDPAWLLPRWRRLVREVGGPSLIVGLACSEHRRYREIGSRLLLKPGPWLSPAREQLGAPLSPDLRVLEEFAQLIPRRESVAPAKKPPRQDGRVKSLENENQQLRQRVAKRDAQIADLQLLMTSAEKDYSVAVDQLRSDLANLRRDRDQLAASLEEQLAARMRQFRRDVLGIGADFAQTQRQWQASSGESMLAEVELVLARQRQLNERHRTLAQIRAEIDQLEHAETRLQLAEIESVVVVPELHGILQEVQNRLSHLRELPSIAEGVEVSGLEKSLDERIRSVAAGRHGAQELEQIEQSLQQEPLRGCLDMVVRRHLLALVQQRRQWLELLEKERALAALPVAVPDPSDAAQFFPAQIWDVRHELEKLEPGSVCIVIDGYNVIKNIDELISLQDRYGLAAARQRLIELCQRKASQLGRCELVFDGDTIVATHETLGGVQVVFAAKRDDSQNADRHIIAQAPQLAGEFAQLWLVTLDGELRYRCRHACTAFLAAADFYTFLVN